MPSTPSTPATPAYATPSRLSGTPKEDTPSKLASPGSWRHPKFDEISQRQRANTFNDSNIHRITYNGIAAAILIYAYHHPSSKSYLDASPELTSIVRPLLATLLLLLAYNIFAAFLPLIRIQDNMTDIPLTPSQRSLLGLKTDTNAPATPGSTGSLYITPPRYQRFTGANSASRSVSGTPRTGNNSPSGSVLSASLGPGTSRGDSPSASPLWQKSQAVAAARRMTGGLRERETAGSPSGGMKGPVPLNSKWLYERGRRNSGLM